jgi:uncharacterized membrane protein YgcG
VHEQDGDLVVALPGTTHPLDWSSNMRVHYVPIDDSQPAPGVATAELEQMPCAHAGFYYRADTIPTLALLEQAAAKGLRLVLTGHSLGGAVANVCTLTALRAQQKARDAAADATARRSAAATAAAAAGLGPKCPDTQQQEQAHTSCSSTRVSPFEAAAGAAATATAQAHTNHSWCSANSDILVSPQAALVEVLCISFASPHWANAKLVGMLEARGWDECFVNVVVPEDYCLKLFNNVLTSAPPSEHNMSPSSSRGGGSSGGGTSGHAKPADDRLDSLEMEFEEAPEAAAAAAAAGASGDGMAAPSSNAVPAAHNEEQKEEEEEEEEEQPRFTYTPNSQQPVASAMAGTRGSRKKKQLSFAMPPCEAAAGEEAADPAAGAAEEAALLRVLAPPAITVPSAAGDIAAVDAGSWGDVRAALPMSPSTASLSSMSSWNSNRSWTLLAYLPDVVLRSFGSSSSSNSSGGGSFNSSGGGGSSTTAAPAAPAGSSSSSSSSSKGWSMRHAKSSINLHTPPMEADSSSSLSSSSSCDSLDCLTGVGGDQLEAQRSGSPTQQQQQAAAAPASQRGSLRRSVSSASMKIFEKSHVKLLQPLSSTLKLGSSSLALVSALLPSMRSLALARRALASTASRIADKAFNVPLTVLEVGLIKALKPPMYQPAGQQWILSATGLVPQHQPIHLYPKHIHDVFWHKELAMVAFREHSIVFYKARLRLQATRR